MSGGPEPVSDERPAQRGWRPRLTALADAQSRYFYALGVAGVFFFALHAGLEAGSVRVLQIDVPAGLVLATGPTVLGFLIQAVSGSVVATDVVAWRMAVLEDVEFEREYTSPSAIDLAFYTTDRSPASVRAAGLLVYPTYLTLFLVEGVWLLGLLTQLDADSSDVGVARWILFVIGIVMLVGAVPRLVILWWRKLSHALVILRHKNTPVRVSRAMETLADITDSLRGAGRKVESRFEHYSYRLYVDELEVARGRSLQELTVCTRDWIDEQAALAEEGSRESDQLT